MHVLATRLLDNSSIIQTAKMPPCPTFIIGVYQAVPIVHRNKWHSY